MGRSLSRRTLSRAQDWGAIADCFLRNGWERSVDELMWQYVKSPTGLTFVNVAECEGEIVAVYASLPQRFQCGVREFMGIQSLDTLTDSQFRGRGLFGALATDLFERTKSEGVGFVYGFPNASSAPGFFGKLGWVKLDPVPFLMRPMNPVYFLEKVFGRTFGLPRIPALPLAGRYDIREIELSELPVNAIWQGFRQSFNVGLVRDSTYLNWRFAKPGQNYRIFCGGEDGAEGFVVINVMEKHGGRIGYVVEMMSRNPSTDTELAHELLNHAVHTFEEERCDAALAWHFEHSPYYLAFLAAGFFPMPERLRPIELHFGVKPLAEENLIVRRDWYISYCDSDTV